MEFGSLRFDRGEKIDRNHTQRRQESCHRFHRKPSSSSMKNRFVNSTNEWSIEEHLLWRRTFRWRSDSRFYDTLWSRTSSSCLVERRLSHTDRRYHSYPLQAVPELESLRFSARWEEETEDAWLIVRCLEVWVILLAFENHNRSNIPICPDWVLHFSSNRHLHCLPCSVLVLRCLAEPEHQQDQSLRIRHQYRVFGFEAAPSERIDGFVMVCSSHTNATDTSLTFSLCNANDFTACKSIPLPPLIPFFFHIFRHVRRMQQATHIQSVRIKIITMTIDAHGGTSEEKEKQIVTSWARFWSKAARDRWKLSRRKGHSACYQEDEKKYGQLVSDDGVWSGIGRSVNLCSTR